MKENRAATRIQATARGCAARRLWSVDAEGLGDASNSGNSTEEGYDDEFEQEDEDEGEVYGEDEFEQDEDEDDDYDDGDFEEEEG